MSVLIEMEEDVDETEEEEIFEDKLKPRIKISEMLFELQELVHREQIEQIKGEMYNGYGGFCLSGGIAWMKGVKKDYLYHAPAILGADGENVFGEYDRVYYCSICSNEYGHGINIQNFLIHLNDDHSTTFGQAGTIMEDMGL